MKNNFSKFDDLIQLMGKAPDVAPPDDFTSKVMLSVDDEKGFSAGKWDFLTRRRTFSLDPVRALRGQAGSQDHFVYSFMIAAAYLIFAVVLSSLLWPRAFFWR